ncbi:hypothetical protein [Lacticaseibacillus sharpeae]|uniref:hypothetical protein n=1 Tax=Lacticaseibacillus sharpeae TaxID=1626 RepID=UPI0006D274BC|nr:hypothetical protein [Lacticaseibacillus sharpeae]
MVAADGSVDSKIDVGGSTPRGGIYPKYERNMIMKFNDICKEFVLLKPILWGLTSALVITTALDLSAGVIGLGIGGLVMTGKFVYDSLIPDLKK